ncbi:MAG: mandelate racemase/muconate lactonizing enzyme family protein [Proteobacteria bacterium]|nr:mandelate racemase/muconate lactonizing enzyme family protein [Pseudomonadota bacterium]
MKIKSVKAIWLSVPIPEAQQHVSDLGRTTSFDSVLVRVETECGLIGHGEAKEEVGSVANCNAVAAAVNKKFGPALIGEDPRDTARLWERMYNGSRDHYALDRGRVFPILGRRGLSVAAIGGIDTALWDILGQSLNAPVWRLLGGRKAKHMPAYASGGWAGADKIGEQLMGYVERGGFNERVRAARKALGDGIGLMCDAHGTFSVPEAKRFCRMVEDCDLTWFEEPVTADDKRGYAEVRAATAIPIAAGESEFTRHDFRDLIDARAVDVLQPDLAICGGITEAMRIAALASAYNLKLAPHLWTGAPAFAAGMHVAAAAPAGFILEYSLGANPLLQDLVQEKFAVKDGMVEIPDRPGLGLTINEDFVKRYAVPLA